jgi:AcrR family transcriptional regulator
VPDKKIPFFDSVWTRPPRARAGQPALSREQIVRTAIEMLDAEGPAGLSMRRLGARLNAGATSLYWHVANKEELLELAVDEIVGEVYAPEARDTSWRIGVAVLAHGMRSMLLRHPWVIGLMGTKPTLGPNAMRLGERTIALLTDGGFTGMEVAHVSSMINAHAIGSATAQSAVATAVQRAGVPATELIAELEPYLDALAPDHPKYDKWRKEYLFKGMDPEDLWKQSFEFGLERMLDGLEHWLSSRPATA